MPILVVDKVWCLATYHHQVLGCICSNKFFVTMSVFGNEPGIPYMLRIKLAELNFCRIHVLLYELRAITGDPCVVE
jgi:hypothetical protein